jgi:hypothetical protein
MAKKPDLDDVTPRELAAAVFRLCVLAFEDRAIERMARHVRRGEVLDEATVDAAIDDAVTVVAGKGDGALRREVRRFVEEARPGLRARAIEFAAAETAKATVRRGGRSPRRASARGTRRPRGKK